MWPLSLPVVLLLNQGHLSRWDVHLLWPRPELPLGPHHQGNGTLSVRARQSGTPQAVNQTSFDTEGVKFRDRLSAVELIVLNVTQAFNTFL